MRLVNHGVLKDGLFTGQRDAPRYQEGEISIFCADNRLPPIHPSLRDRVAMPIAGDAQGSSGEFPNRFASWAGE